MAASMITIMPFNRGAAEAGGGRDHLAATFLPTQPPCSRMGAGRGSPSGRSGRAPSPQSSRKLAWLPTLDERLPKGCRGMVPMTSGSSRSNLDVPGMSTQTWGGREQAMREGARTPAPGELRSGGPGGFSHHLPSSDQRDTLP